MDDRAVDNGPGLRFSKMHGLGNDFVLIDQREDRRVLSPELVRAIGDRHRGVGFDQLAEILPDGDAAAQLIFWNADGTTAGACGNATRCIAHMLMEESGADALDLRTERGLLACSRRADGIVQVDMGTPILDWQQIPLSEAVDTSSLPIQGAPASCSMGNPHCTFFVEDAEAVALERLGAEIEHHPLFPQRTNVQFVQVLAPDRARVRVWERGVGVTLASGSSSCAVLVNAHRRGLMDRSARLTLDGGEIEITWREDDHVLMAGPIAHSFTGILAPDLVG
ncbi:diaminopimelate epimerase [Rhodobacteraceae bacterium NNCM2]|nr:diaminopimelate epimerase [Coraliihabitans acroporae]